MLNQHTITRKKKQSDIDDEIIELEKQINEYSEQGYEENSSLSSSNKSSNKLTLIGICLLTISSISFTIMCAIGQKEPIHIIQLMIGQYIIQLLLSTILWNCKCINYNKIGLKSLSINNNLNWYGNKPYIYNVWLRGFFLFLVEFTLWFALKKDPIGDVTCIHYINPIIIVFGARIFFNEKLPKVFIFTCIIPIIAMIFIVQPEFIFNDNNNNNNNAKQLDLIGVLSAFLSAIAWAIAMLLGRRYDENSHFLQIEFANSIQSLFIWVPLLIIYNKFEYLFYDTNKFKLFLNEPYNWNINIIWIMICVGILLFIGVQFVVFAYQYAQASKIGYFEYLDLIFSFLTQIFIFKDHSNLYSILGFLLMYN